MKTVAFVVALAAAGAVAMPVLAQEYPGSGWNNSSKGMNNTSTGQIADTNNRLSGGNRRDRVDDLVYQDRQALKLVKKALKEAKTDEERKALQEQKRALENDIIALQQG